MKRCILSCSSLPALYLDLPGEEIWILPTMAVPGKLPSPSQEHLHCWWLAGKGRPPGGPLPKHSYSDKFLGASSRHASYLRAQSSMRFPVKLRGKVMLSVQKSQDRNCKKPQSEDYKVGSTFLTNQPLYLGNAVWWDRQEMLKSNKGESIGMLQLVYALIWKKTVPPALWTHTKKNPWFIKVYMHKHPAETRPPPFCLFLYKVYEMGVYAEWS